MHTLKVCVLGSVSCFHQCLKSRFHQGAHAAAQNCLLTEQVGLCLYFEGGLQNTGSCSAQRLRVCQRHIQRFSGIVLLYSHQTGSSSSNLILASYGMAGSLGSDHGYVHVLGRTDLAEVDGKAMGEHQHVALLQVGLDGLFVHLCLFLVVDQNHDHIRAFCGLCRSIYFEALCLSFRPGFASLIQSDDDVASGFLQVQRMCVTLASVADNSDGLVLQQTHVAIFLVINLYCHLCFLLVLCKIYVLGVLPSSRLTLLFPQP